MGSQLLGIFRNTILPQIFQKGKKQGYYEAWRVAITNLDAESFKLLIHASMKGYSGFSDKSFCGLRQF